MMCLCLIALHFNTKPAQPAMLALLERVESKNGKNTYPKASLGPLI